MARSATDEQNMRCAKEGLTQMSSKSKYDLQSWSWDALSAEIVRNIMDIYNNSSCTELFFFREEEWEKAENYSLWGSSRDLKNAFIWVGGAS